MQNVTLIRHAYVRSSSQKRGIDGQLLSHLRGLASGPVLIGTWADAIWAIRFYERYGFQPVGPEEKSRLLNTTGLCPNARSKRPWCWATRSGGKRSADASRFLAACYGGRRCAA